MRSVLLWMAGNPWLSTHLPRWSFARRAVRRFMPGEGFEAALKAAADFRTKGVGAIFTRLGENVSDMKEAEGVVEHYEEVLAASSGVGAEISVKPTQLGLDIDAEAAYANLERLALAAARAKCFMWIDMEGSGYTDRTLAMYRRLRPQHANTGIAIQAYLHRTPADIAALMPLRPSIRLVKGAYAEPAGIAYTVKKDVDASYMALTVMMLPEIKHGRLRLVLGTHDTDLLTRIWRYADAVGVERARVEVAMLYGIRTDEQLRLAREGFVVRDLISYGDAWYAWYVRRLAERPANMWFVARQLLP